MQRASHALVVDGGSGSSTPSRSTTRSSAPPASASLAGVLQLLDRHDRDCAALAERFGVPHLKVPDEVPGTPFEAIPVVRIPRLEGDRAVVAGAKALIVAEVVGTNDLYTAGEAGRRHAPDAPRAAARRRCAATSPSTC